MFTSIHDVFNEFLRKMHGLHMNFLPLMYFQFHAYYLELLLEKLLDICLIKVYFNLVASEERTFEVHNSLVSTMHW